MVKTKEKLLSISIAIFIVLGLIASLLPQRTFAATGDVVVMKDSNSTFGSSWGDFDTRYRWITYINGEQVDVEDEIELNRSYAYCVQPSKDPPPEGSYSVEDVIDDSGTGWKDKMRKLIYYLPGGAGYDKKTKKKWFSGFSFQETYYVAHIALSVIYEGDYSGTSGKIRNKVDEILEDVKTLPDPPDSFEVFWIRVNGKQDLFGAFYAHEYGNVKIKKTEKLNVL